MHSYKFFFRRIKTPWLCTILTLLICTSAIGLVSCNPVDSIKKERKFGRMDSYPLSQIALSQNLTNTPVALEPYLSVTSTSSSIFTNTSFPTTTLTPTPDTRPIPYYWREWATNPELSLKAKGLIVSLINNPDLDIHTFSKVGDCQMTPETFLGGFVTGKYIVPDGYEATVDWFSESMTDGSVTAANGLGINSVLSPMFGLPAGHVQCDANETPLDCELRTKHPAFVLIAMGTNWKPGGEMSFEKYLRVVVDRILETGALPILATKADNIEGDWKLNLVIAEVAYDYDLPLVNVWRSVQDLPNHGLELPKNIYLTGDGWMRRNFAWLDILREIHILINE